MRPLLLFILVCVINTQSACPKTKFSFRPTAEPSSCLDKEFKLVPCEGQDMTSFDSVVVQQAERKVYETDAFSIISLSPGFVKLSVNGKCLTVTGGVATQEDCTPKTPSQNFHVVPEYSNEPAKGEPFREEHIANARPYYMPPSTYTPAPATCKPVHMEHVGRHASRHVNLKKQFTNPIRVLEFAKSQGSLTPLAEELLLAVQILENQTDFIPERQLTPQGFQSAYEIGSRMVQSFPEIFLAPSVFNLTTNRKIVMDATPTSRTEQTRDFYLRGMIDSGIDSASIKTIIPDHCSRSFINMRAFDTCQWYKGYTRNSTVFNALAEINEKLGGPEGIAERFHQLMFLPGFQPAGADSAKIDFVQNWWQYVCTFQINVNRSNTGEACSVFTAADGELFSYLEDTQLFLTHSRVPDYPVDLALSCGLIEEIGSGLEKAIQESELRKASLTKDSPPIVIAHLRFAHKETIIPLLGSLWLNVEDPFLYKNFDKPIAEREFIGSKLFMMGSNVQFILYECGETYKVRFMLNEEERVIPGCDGVYCDWKIMSDILNRASCDEALHDQVCGGFDQSICNSIDDPNFKFDKR